MSIVCCTVSKDEISIASDSISIRGVTQDKGTNKYAKLCSVDDMIIGGVGTAAETSLLQIYCKTTKPASATEKDMLIFLSEFSDWKKKKTDKYGIDNVYIFIFCGKVFMLEGFFINEILTYAAIGSGMDYALAALYLGSGVEKAVKTACELSVFCEEPINKIIVQKSAIR